MNPNNNKWSLIQEIVSQSVKGRDLTRAKLIRANLSHAKLIRANLIDVNLNGANLSHAKLIRANLIDVNLNGADLSHVNLSHADLIDVNLNDADLSGSKVKNSFWSNSGISDSLRQDLLDRGAIFEDSPPKERDPSAVLVSL